MRELDRETMVAAWIWRWMKLVKATAQLLHPSQAPLPARAPSLARPCALTSISF